MHAKFRKERLRSQKLMNDMMDKNVNPCDDFQEFACGQFNRDTVIPDGVGLYESSYSEAAYAILERGRFLLERETDESGTDSFKSFDLIKQYYKSCMNHDRKEDLGVQPLLDVLDQVGGWPLLHGKSFHNWYNRLKEHWHLGLPTDMLLGVTLEKGKIFVDGPKLGLPAKTLAMFTNHKDIQTYFDFMVNASILIGADEVQARQDLQEVLDLEIALAQIIHGNKPTFTTSYFDVSEAVFDNNTKTIKQIASTITGHSVVAVWTYYTNRLGPLLNKTSGRTIANYIGWRLVHDLMPSLNKVARTMASDFGKATRQLVKPDWRICVEESGFSPKYTLAPLEVPASSMYVHTYLKSNVIRDVQEMLDLLKLGFEERLKKNEWVDEDTKKRALDKINVKMSFILGFHPDLKNSSRVDETVSGLNVTSSMDYMSNKMNVIRHYRARRHVDDNDLGTADLRQILEEKPVLLVNAISFITDDVVEICGGIIQSMFYNETRPAFLNFGGLGWMMGHEIGHAFDTYGYTEDFIDSSYGKDESFKTAFKKRTECVRMQYGNYSVPQVKKYIDGKKTLDENIADITGLFVAYEAYSK